MCYLLSVFFLTRLPCNQLISVLKQVNEFLEASPEANEYLQFRVDERPVNTRELVREYRSHQHCTVQRQNKGLLIRCVRKRSRAFSRLNFLFQSRSNYLSVLLLELIGILLILLDQLGIAYKIKMAWRHRLRRARTDDVHNSLNISFTDVSYRLKVRKKRSFSSTIGAIYALNWRRLLKYRIIMVKFLDDFLILFIESVKP